MKTLVDGIHQLRGMLGFTLPETEDCSVKVELIDVLFRLRLVREEVIVNKDHRLIFDLGLRTPAFISRCGKIIQLCSVPTCYEKQENVFYNLSLCSDHVKYTKLHSSLENISKIHALYTIGLTMMELESYANPALKPMDKLTKKIWDHAIDVLEQKEVHRVEGYFSDFNVIFKDKCCRFEPGVSGRLCTHSYCLKQTTFPHQHKNTTS